MQEERTERNEGDEVTSAMGNDCPDVGLVSRLHRLSSGKSLNRLTDEDTGSPPASLCQQNESKQQAPASPVSGTEATQYAEETVINTEDFEVLRKSDSDVVTQQTKTEQHMTVDDQSGEVTSSMMQKTVITETIGTDPHSSVTITTEHLEEAVTRTSAEGESIASESIEQTTSSVSTVGGAPSQESQVIEKTTTHTVTDGVNETVDTVNELLEPSCQPDYVERDEADASRDKHEGTESVMSSIYQETPDPEPRPAEADEGSVSATSPSYQAHGVSLEEPSEDTHTQTVVESKPETGVVTAEQPEPQAHTEDADNLVGGQEMADTDGVTSETEPVRSVSPGNSMTEEDMDTEALVPNQELSPPSPDDSAQEAPVVRFNTEMLAEPPSGM